MGFSFDPEQAEVINKTFLAVNKTVTTSETLISVGGSNATGRQEIVLFNKSNVTIYLGPTGVTTSGANEGLPLEPQESFTQTLSENLSLYGIADSSATILIWELG